MSKFSTAVCWRSTRARTFFPPRLRAGLLAQLGSPAVCEETERQRKLQTFHLVLSRCKGLPTVACSKHWGLFTGAVFTAHGGHLILTCLSLRAQSTGAFPASMIRMQHRRPLAAPTPPRGTGDPLTLTSIGSCVGCTSLVSPQTLSRPLTASAVSGDMVVI